MILVLTNEGPKTTAIEEIVVGAINEEFQKFRNEYKDATLKLLTMSFGTGGINNVFLDKLTKATVRTNQWKEIRNTAVNQSDGQTDRQTDR